MPVEPMRRTLITFALLIAAAGLAVGGFFVGEHSADRRWVGDMNRLGQAMRRLDRDIKARGGGVVHDSDYFLKLSDLPLEGFGDQTVTYYVGPAARHSATIEFDETGVKGVSVR